MTIWRVWIACWKPKASNTHSEYVLLIVFPLQQWLDELALMVPYTYSTLTALFILSSCDSKGQLISPDAREIKNLVFEQKLCTIPQQMFIKFLLINSQIFYVQCTQDYCFVSFQFTNETTRFLYKVQETFSISTAWRGAKVQLHSFSTLAVAPAD
jgi:hypothetical protein